MKLELNRKLIPDSLFHELDFTGFLSLFEINMPLLPRVTLNPLKKKDGETQFEHLRTLEKHIAAAKTDLKAIISKSSKLPFLDYLLPFFKSQRLEPYHLHSLGHFVSEDLGLEKLEKNFPVTEEFHDNDKIKKILETHTTKRFSGIRLSKQQKELKKEIEGLEKELTETVSLYEKKINHETELKMIYPYPKEILQNDKRLDLIKSCNLVSLASKGEILLVNYRLPKEMAAIVNKKQEKDDELTVSTNKTLSTINRALYPFYKGFNDYYEKRKKRVYAYVLLWAKERHALCYPDFRESACCQIEKGILPVLKKQTGKTYVPLSIDLEKGASVLFGANMTGKTTVLKTLYFHLIAVKAGLPVPATSFAITFPDHIAIQLKSSGTVSSGLSGFGEEIAFFCEKVGQNAFILVDELFQSTDPVTGAVLSEVILEEFSSKNLLFFCTSHYPEVLKVNGPSFFRMKDFPHDHIKEMNFQDLLLNIPYEVEKLSLEKMNHIHEQNKKSLSIALMFPLPDTIKKRILHKLGREDNHGKDSS